MIKPKQQITRVFDMNCASAIYEYKSSIFSVKMMMFWCLRINGPIVTMDIADFWLLDKISNNLSRRMSIWPPACSTYRNLIPLSSYVTVLKNWKHLKILAKKCDFINTSSKFIDTPRISETRTRARIKFYNKEHIIIISLRDIGWIRSDKLCLK